MICHGNHDVGRTMEHAEALRRGIPHARFELFDTGHSMMVEAPERFIAVLTDFRQGLAW